MTCVTVCDSPGSTPGFLCFVAAFCVLWLLVAKISNWGNDEPACRRVRLEPSTDTAQPVHPLKISKNVFFFNLFFLQTLMSSITDDSLKICHIQPERLIFFTVIHSCQRLQKEQNQDQVSFGFEHVLCVLFHYILLYPNLAKATVFLTINLLINTTFLVFHLSFDIILYLQLWKLLLLKPIYW